MVKFDVNANVNVYDCTNNHVILQKLEEIMSHIEDLVARLEGIGTRLDELDVMVESLRDQVAQLTNHGITEEAAATLNAAIDSISTKIDAVASDD